MRVAAQGFVVGAMTLGNLLNWYLFIIHSFKLETICIHSFILFIHEYWIKMINGRGVVRKTVIFT